MKYSVKIIMAILLELTSKYNGENREKSSIEKWKEIERNNIERFSSD